MSQIEIELSSLATAMTDSSLGWNLIDVMGSVCQLKLISSWEWAFYFCFRKSQTFTEQSSDPVTIRFGVVLLQSQTFTSLSWALIRSWDFLKSPTLKSTICSVPSEEPTLNKFYMKQRQSVSWGKTQYPQRILCDSYKPHFWTKKYMFDCYRKLTLTQAYFLITAVRFCEGSNSKQNLPIYFAG